MTCINDVMRVLQKRPGENWTTVRIAAPLMAPLEDLVKNAKDEFGLPLFRSKTDAVTEAVKEFLKKYSAQQSSSKQGGRSSEPTR